MTSAFRCLLTCTQTRYAKCILDNIKLQIPKTIVKITGFNSYGILMYVKKTIGGLVL